MKILLALLADIANGIFATLITATLFGVEPTWHYFVGIAFTFIPDIDIIFVKDGDHRSGLHFPVVFITLGIIFIFISGFWGTLFLIATMLHFVNDMYGTGWGVPLFWPLSKKRYKLFSRKGDPFTEKREDDVVPVKSVVTWTEDELKQHEEKYGNKNWIEDTYLRVTWISVTQYTIFTIALVLVVLEFYF